MYKTRYNKVLTPVMRAPSPTSVCDSVVFLTSDRDDVKETLNFDDQGMCSLQRLSTMKDFEASLDDEDMKVLETEVFNNTSKDFPLPGLSVASELQQFNAEMTDADVDFLNNYFQDGSEDFPLIVD